LRASLTPARPLQPAPFMRNHRRVLLLTLAVLGLRAVPAEAENLYIDRPRRTVEVPDECTNPGAALSQNLAYNNAFAPNRQAPININNVDGRFTMLLSESAHLRARNHDNNLELAWFNFQPGNADENLHVNEVKALVRAYVLMRCGLPVANHDDQLYAMPAAGAARTNFIQYAMGDRNGPDPRVATGYTLIGNGEREGILMYAAHRIKFDLTPTIAGRGRVCVLYASNDLAWGCAVDVAPANAGDEIIGFLWQGMNRTSYTAHEFWMMMRVDEYRNKVFFTHDVHNANGNDVDQFMMWNGHAIAWDFDAGGDNANYPPEGGAPEVAYRFQNIVTQAHNERDFYQGVMPGFIAHYHPRIMIDQPYQ